MSTDGPISLNEARERKRKERMEQLKEKARKRSNGKIDPKGIVWGHEIVPRDINWLWYPRIACEQVNIIAGMGSHGKGMLSMDCAARVTVEGTRWPIDDYEAPTGVVLWCECEDPIDSVLYQRFVAAGGDLKKIAFVDRLTFYEMDIAQFIKEHDARLVVLSPLLSFMSNTAMGTELRNKNDEAEVRETLERLQYAVEGTNCALLGICHLNKKADLTAVERIMGAGSFVNFTRSVMGSTMTEDENGDKVFRLVHLKHNLSARAQDLIATPTNRSEDKRGQFWGLDWEEADDNIDTDRSFDRVKKSEDAGDGPTEWLMSYLVGQKDHMASVADALKAGELNGFKANSLRMVKKRSAGIDSMEMDGVHFWRIKDKPVPVF